MWYKNLDNNYFIMQLYNNVPSIINVPIDEINITNEGDTISIVFDMPVFADNPPQKWIDAKYNTIVVSVDLFDIKNIEIKSNDRTYRGDINITKDKDDIIISIMGSVEANIIASVGIIQSVEAYYIEL